MSRTSRVYDTAEWRRVRLRVLARDRYQCTVGLTPHGCKPAKAVDHILALSEGGSPYDMANLRAVCTACNTRLRNARRAALARYQLGEPAPRPRQPSARRPRNDVTTLTW